MNSLEELTETVRDIVWTEESSCDGTHTLYAYRIKGLGRITVLDRLTGYIGGIRDIETGFKDNNNNFWLASGNCDIRNYPDKTFEEAIQWIKANANISDPC